MPKKPTEFTVTEEIAPSDPMPSNEFQEEERQQQIETMKRVKPDLVSVAEATETAAPQSVDPSAKVSNNIGVRKRLDPSEVKVGEGPLVDGARYIVVAKRFSSEEVRPLYVTDALTGERLPTLCLNLTHDAESDTWLAQLQSRVADGLLTHEGLDPVSVIFKD